MKPYRHILLQETEGKCIYCGKQLEETDRRGYSIDHIIPISHGGKKVLDNYVACCNQCNWKKADMTVYEFLGLKDPDRWERFKSYISDLVKRGLLTKEKAELLCQEHITEYPHIEQRKVSWLTRRKLMKENRGFCIYCGKPLNELSFVVDHIIPLSKGGTNGYKNLLACCSPCLLEKGNRTAIEYFYDYSAHRQRQYKRRIYENVCQGRLPQGKGLLLAPDLDLPKKKVFRLRIGRLKMSLGFEIARKKGDI